MTATTAGRPASLPMYPEAALALATFWAGLRGHLAAAGIVGVPAMLAEPTSLEAHWALPDLLLSQTCGYPLVTSLAGRVRYVATFAYAAPGCAGASYSSALVVRTDDPAAHLAGLRGRRVAVNAPHSHSGCNALRAMVAPLADGGRFFAAHVTTGAHRRSIAAVREGQADLAAIDAVTFELLRRVRPAEIQGLRVLGWSDRAPGLPLITALATTPDELAALRLALRQACDDPALAAARAAVLISDVEVLSDDAYAACARMADAAVAAGYPDLA